MAQDDGGERTEQPTARRRAEARDKGQIARSTDLTAAVSLLAGLLALKTLGPGLLSSLFAMTRAIGDPAPLVAQDLTPWIYAVAQSAMGAVVPLLAVLMVLTAAGVMIQTGLLLTWSRLALKPERINPVEGAKKLFSFEAISRLVMGLLKMAVIGAVAWFFVTGRIREVVSTGGLSAGHAFLACLETVFGLAVRLAVVLLLLGIIDYLYQLWRHEKNLKMTKQEVRDEMKRMDGDPLVKQRRRQVQLQLAMQRIRSAVPKADVVVTNPTHYAVALRYDQAEMNAPRVVAKGKDFLAERILEIARQFSVPVVQRPPLARALYATVEVGQEVPPQFYRAIAELLAYVYQLSGKAAG